MAHAACPTATDEVTSAHVAVLADWLATAHPTWRHLTAASHHTPADVLHLLAHHPRGGVRWAVATNRTCPPQTLAVLADDRTNLDVRVAALVNPATPADALERNARDGWADVRATVARNSACPARLLTELAGDGVPEVRRAVARHPGCPQQVRRRLARDADAGVRAAAQAPPDPRPQPDEGDDTPAVGGPLGELLAAVATTSPAQLRAALALLDHWDGTVDELLAATQQLALAR